MKSMLDQYVAARRAATPLIGIQSADPALTITEIMSVSNEATPLIQWDLVRGWQSLNPPGIDAMREALRGDDPVACTIEPAEMLVRAVDLPPGTVLFVLNANRYLNDESPRASAGVMQALWNLRDSFKETTRTVVLLGTTIKLPIELQGDVMLIDEPLPDDQALERIAGDLVQSFVDPKGKPRVNFDEVKTKVVDAVRGIAGFPAEQAIAMSLTDNGIDLDGLWERKRRMVEQTDGLSIWRGRETFSDIGGVSEVKQFLQDLFAGNEPPRLIVWIDEIEKAMAGSRGDSSGVSQSFHGTLLKEMQDSESSGMLFFGHPGTAKSLVAKAIGSVAGLLTIALDFGAMKDSLVGASEAKIRTAFKTINAVGQGRTLYIATCNQVDSLSTELRRRFSLGDFFFDLPDAEEQAAIWPIHLKRFKLSDTPQGIDTMGWTGAEIERACSLSYKLNRPLKDVAKYVVPISKSAAEEIESRRRRADRRFLSASRPGVFEFQSQAQPPVMGAKRNLGVKGDQV